MTEAEKRRIEAEDLYRFQLIRHLDLSPDGRHVVYALARASEEDEKKYSNLWIVPTGGGEAWQLTVGDQIDAKPRWSPDGSQIAFLSNRADEKQVQIYVIPFRGGEARRLTDFKGSLETFEWAPDSARLVCQHRKKDPEAIEREADEKKKRLGIVYRHIDRLHYSLDAVGYFPKERWHLWIVDVKRGEARQLTDGPIYDETAPTWSPDGKEIAYLSNYAPEPDLEREVVDVFVIPAEGGEARRLNTPIGTKHLPSYSPDGTRVAYFGTEGRGNWWKNDAVWVVPANGEGEARNLMEAYDRAASVGTLNDLGGLIQPPPAWSPDGERLYFQVSHHGSTTLNVIPASGGELEEIVGSGGVVGSFAFDADYERLAYFRGSMLDPGQIWLREMATGETRQLTQVNAALLGELALGEVEEIWFEGPDGNDLQGWILKPPDFDPERVYPAILEIHGGPLAQYGNAFMHEFFYLAAQDYVVYFSNPRGGIGYGEEHARAIWGGWGEADYADLMAWADYVEALPYTDPERMGVTGGSYGGYMTAWIVGHTGRFEAAVAQRSVTNLISFWGSGDLNWIFQQPFGDRPPYESIEQLWESSPIKHIGSATTPTMVVHSEQDLRCPLEQGQQLFVALKTLGVDTEFIVFPEEPHGLSRVGRTDRRIVRLQSIRRWFDRYLKEAVAVAGGEA